MLYLLFDRLRTQSVAILAVCCVVVAADVANAQAIYIGQGGISLRGKKVKVGGFGVRVSPTITRQVQPLPYQGYTNPGPSNRVIGHPYPYPTTNAGNNFGPGRNQFNQRYQPYVVPIVGQTFGTQPFVAPQVGAQQVGPRQFGTTNSVSDTGAFLATNPEARPHLRAAESAMRAGDYGNAETLVKRAVRKDRTNGVLRLFSSQVHLAAGDYEEAADELDLATSTLEKGQWGIVIRNIHRVDSPNRYQNSLRKLATFLNAHPNSQEALALYGFHTAYAGQPQTAARMLELSLRIDPDYALAERLRSSMVIARTGSELSKNVKNPNISNTTSSEASVAKPATPAPPKQIQNPWSQPSQQQVSRGESMQIRSGSQGDVEILSGVQENLIDLVPSEQASPSPGKPVSILRN